MIESNGNWFLQSLSNVAITQIISYIRGFFSKDRKVQGVADTAKKWIEESDVHTSKGHTKLFIEILRTKSLCIELASTQDQIIENMGPRAGILKPGRSIDRAYGTFKEDVSKILLEQGEFLPCYMKQMLQDALDEAHIGHKGR